MRIHIRGHKVLVSAMLHDHCEEQLERAVEKFRGHVREAELVFMDVNGPRPFGYACRLLLSLDDGRQILSECRGENFYAVSARAAQRAAARLQKQLGRRRTLGRDAVVAW